MINVIEYELVGDPIVVDSLFTALRIEKDSDINKLVFSIAVDKKCLTKYLDYFKEEIIGLTTSSGEYFEVLDDFLLNKRMCEKYTYRLLFNIKDVEKSPSDYSNIILDKTLDNLVMYIIGNDQEVNNEVIVYLNNMYNNSITVEELQNVSKDLILIRKGIELGKVIKPDEIVKEDNKDSIFEIVEDFDVSLHAFLIMVINNIKEPINEIGVLSNVFETVKSYFNSCNIKDVIINVNNYKHIIDSIGKHSMLIERYDNSQTRSLTILTIVEVLFMAMEVFELNKTNGLSEKISDGELYKNTQVEILKDLIETDVLKVFKLIIRHYDNLFLINQALTTIESREENAERN